MFDEDKSHILKNQSDHKVDLKLSEKREEAILINDVTMHNSLEDKTKIEKMIIKWRNLWKEKDFTIKISKSVHMSISLKLNWADKIKTNRVYSFDVKDQVLIDETFDKLHAQNKIK